ncbi:DUF1848 family protein [Aminivibrio sp.]|uniref:DUF1848 family protein n=1 Tax=Aminivibrio sp. TaxID=1872489 RepID=UPI003D97D8CC
MKQLTPPKSHPEAGEIRTSAMIISVSRRTDIPAFYAPWFERRLRDGFALVRNPRNPAHVRRISLIPSDVDCFVFWTKDARPLFGLLDRLDEAGYPYYFQWTVTPYGSGIMEPGDRAEGRDPFSFPDPGRKDRPFPGHLAVRSCDRLGGISGGTA